MASTAWTELLAPIRENITGRDHRGKKGSLGWLEAVVAEQGGRSGTVRNILYKDLGSHEEKLRLFNIIKNLYEQLELPAPDLPADIKTATAKRMLGRDKRLIFAQFIRQYQLDMKPQIVVVGWPATGKSVLLEQIREALDESVFLNLAQDLAPVLHQLAGTLNVEEQFEQLLAQLSPAQPYALQAEHQHDMRQLITSAVNQSHVTLLIRAESKATLGGVALRDRDGQEVTVSTWLEPVLKNLQVPYFVACSSAPPTLPYKTLRPPSRREARAYLQQRLPDSPAETIESILNKAGRNYGELSRLALLELSRSGEEASEAKLLNDPRMGRLLKVLAALSPEADPGVPVALLEQVMGKPITEFTQAEHALIEASGEGMFRPSVRALLPADTDNKAVHQQAFTYYQQQPGDSQDFRVLYHARAAGLISHVTDRLAKDASQLALMPGLWEASATWPAQQRENLAFAVVRYRAVLGDYAHPECKEALACLMNSQSAHTSGWAKVKMSEALIDEGRYEHAQTLMQNLPELHGDAKAEALLVHAALARWQGHYTRAEQHVNHALELPIPPMLADRVNLWQGLVAKDAGRFDEARLSLQTVQHVPLLIARARYQEGDLLIRVGQAAEGVQQLREALVFLPEAASAEERARMRARLGTALRHVGAYREAAAFFRRALKDVPDAFTRARIMSEASIFESARGRPWEALKLAGQAGTFFQTTSERSEEAAYRYHRTLYRLAVAYWTWESGTPFRAPFRGGRTCERSNVLLEQLLPLVEPLVNKADRYAFLYLDALVLLSLNSPPELATSYLSRLSGLSQGYLKQQMSLAKTEVLLRAGDHNEAAVQLMSIRQLPPDPGVQAWKILLEAQLMLCLEQPAVACSVIEEAFLLPAVFRGHIGWCWGQVLQEHKATELAKQWLDTSEPLALPEALGMVFEAKTG